MAVTYHWWRKERDRTNAKSKEEGWRINCLKVVTVALLAGAASTVGAETMELRVLEQGTFCGDEQASARWLSENDVPVLHLSMGQQPSGGFGIRLAEPEAEFVQGAWEIVVQWREPAPGEAVTMALTLPCLTLAGSWPEQVPVRVVDQSGRLRLEAETGSLK